jgi:hypothetical protein
MAAETRLSDPVEGEGTRIISEKSVSTVHFILHKVITIHGRSCVTVSKEYADKLILYKVDANQHNS